MAARIGMARVSRETDRLEVGGRLIALAGFAVFLYGLLVLVINFTSFTEIGLSATQAGGEPSAISTFSQSLYNYMSHLQVALSAFIMAYALQVTALAWFGVRRGQVWALWTVAIASALAYAVAVPLHFVYGLATLVHLGPFALVAVVLVAGIALARSGMRPGA